MDVCHVIKGEQKADINSTFPFPFYSLIASLGNLSRSVSVILNKEPFGGPLIETTLLITLCFCLYSLQHLAWCLIAPYWASLQTSC
jgi:hypothetical protein